MPRGRFDASDTVLKSTDDLTLSDEDGGSFTESCLITVDGEYFARFLRLTSDIWKPDRNGSIAAHLSSTRAGGGSDLATETDSKCTPF